MPSHNCSLRPGSGHATGRKMALLIGIAYDMHEYPSPQFPQLSQTHKDVEAVKEYLEGNCGFHSNDIIVMRDKPGTDRGLLPLHDNIELLVVLHYAGHGDQLNAHPDSEESDGMDENMVPMDHGGCQDRFLRDNWLKKSLVAKIPTGAKLTMIFDCCHSGTMADLKHRTCNRVRLWKLTNVASALKMFTPGSSKARRARIAASGWKILRAVHKAKCAVVLTHSSSTNFISTVMTVSHEGAGKITTKNAVSTGTSLAPLSLSKFSPIFKPTTNARKISPSIHNPVINQIANIPKLQRSRSTFSRRQKWPKCRGSCSPRTVRKQDVISLSACRDHEQTMENDAGLSLSQVLIRILRNQPDITYKQLMRQIICEVYKVVDVIHDFKHDLTPSRQNSLPDECKDSIRNGSGPRGTTSCTTAARRVYGWLPQLTSQEPVDMDKPFSLLVDGSSRPTY